MFLSYYEGDCDGIQPSAGTWTAHFKALHALYPQAQPGFGEIGLGHPVTSRTISTAKSMISDGMPAERRDLDRDFKALRCPVPAQAQLGFGEIGLGHPVNQPDHEHREVDDRYYYGLPIHLPYYAGGHFWWYYYEDCLPYGTKPLWQAICPACSGHGSAGHRKGQRSIFAKKDNLRRGEAEALAEKAWTAHNSRLGEGYDISSA